MEAKRKDIEFVAINDLGTAEANAHLLKYDSVHSTYPGKIEAGKDHIKVDGKKVKVLSERDPAKLPWGKLGVDVVLERSEEHTSELQSLMRISYAVFCLTKKTKYKTIT